MTPLPRFGMFEINDDGIPESDTDTYTITVYTPFHIEVMKPEIWYYSPVDTDSYENYNFYGYLLHEAFVITSDPYHKVDWYVDEELKHTKSW